jgi:hypothetical protein
MNVSHRPLGDRQLYAFRILSDVAQLGIGDM